MNTDVLCQLKDLWKQAFGDSEESIEAFFATGFSPERFQYLEEDGKVVCALYWFDCGYLGGKLAYIYALATLPEYRGRGLAARLLEKTHSLLKSLGYDGAILKPAQGLFPYYAKQGYRTCGYVSRPHVSAGDIPVALRELSGEEFAALRRSFLPQGGVVQEGAAVEFLSTFCRFWTGADCLLCAGRYEPAIYEFLGALSSLPGALKALQIPCADPIVPGDDIPLLMYLPLCDPMETPPKYLGLPME